MNKKKRGKVNSTVQYNSATGIEEFDAITGGGFPSGSTVLLSGSSGSGKTIFSFQWLFNGIKENENGVYIALTEPLFKTVKNIEGMNFYNRAVIESENIKIIDLRNYFEQKMFGHDKIIRLIERIMKETNAKRLCIDSITAIAYTIDDKSQIRRFIFELGKVLATLGCTTLLTSEVADRDRFSMYGVEEFISDAIIRFDQVRIKNELQRTMQIIKIRGKAYNTETLFFKISENGINIFPRLYLPLEQRAMSEKVSIGITGLDKMLNGGVFKASSSLVAGTTGTGKSLLSLHFISEGLKKGEPCLYAGFSESKEHLIRNARSFGWEFDKYEKKGLLILRCNYPSEKFIGEHLQDIKNIIDKNNIKRCVIDSLSDLFDYFPRDIFMTFIKRLNAYLKNMGVTSIFTIVSSPAAGLMPLNENNLASLTDNTIIMRFVEIEGELKSVINIVKVKGSAHNKELRKYDITGKGILIGQSLSGYEGIMTGVTRKVSKSVDEKLESEFRRFIGPMAESALYEIKQKGLDRQSILDYIEQLVNEKILNKDDAGRFKQNVSIIFGSYRKKAFNNKNNNERKGLFTRLLGQK